MIASRDSWRCGHGEYWRVWPWRVLEGVAMEGVLEGVEGVSVEGVLEGVAV